MDDRQYGCEQNIYNNLANVLILYRFVLELHWGESALTPAPTNPPLVNHKSVDIRV